MVSTLQNKEKEKNSLESAVSTLGHKNHGPSNHKEGMEA